MKTLETIQQELRELVAQGTDLVLAALKKALRNDTDCYGNFLNLEGRYQDLSRQLLQGIVSNDFATLEFNKIRHAVIEFINCLTANDLLELAETTSETTGMSDVYNGEVLYRIPKKMQLGIESECIVRLAFERKTILHDFQVQAGDVMKDLRISDVMGVELLDPNSDKAFSITTLHDTVQFVDKGLVTEWIFCVTPLKQGQFPLVLKISIIEIINGIERKRNEVLKEQVEILTELPKAEATGFVAAGYAWQVLQPDEQRAIVDDIGGSKAFEPPTESVPPSPAIPSPRSPQTIPLPSPSPQAPVPSRSGNFRKIGTVLGALAALLISVFAMRTYLGENHSGEMPTMVEGEDLEWLTIRNKRSRTELENFVEKYPGTNESAQALNILDTLENEAWQVAATANDTASMKEYLAEYPEGKFVDDATLRLWQLGYDWSEPSFVEMADSAIVSPNPPPPAPANKDVKATKPLTTKKEKEKQKTVTKPPKTTSGTQPNSKTNPQATNKKTEAKPSKVDPNLPVVKEATARKPVFKGCSDKDKAKEEKCTLDRIQRFLRNRFEYPQAAIEKSIEGTVNVSFVIEKDGSVKEVHATNDIGGGCAAEAEHLVKKLPKFQPGMNASGQPVRVIYNQPVRFKLK